MKEKQNKERNERKYEDEENNKIKEYRRKAE
jgi:hypothetical protein